MSKEKFSETAIIKILKEAEQGIPVPDLCRNYGMSRASFYKWRSKYGGMNSSLISEMKFLTQENKRLKKMYTDSQLQNEILKEVLGKK